MTAARLDLDPATSRVLDDYLGALAARLTGPTRARQTILAELRDGLVEATHARLAGGASQAQAAAAAVTEFGDPATVAAAFTPELAAATARRVALTLIATGPLVGGLWLSVLAPSGLATPAAAPPWQWPIIQAGGWPARLLLAVIAAAILAAWLTVAATGQLTRWLPARPRLAPTTATFAAAGTGLVDVSLLTTGALAIPHAAAWPPVAVAATASLIRCCLASRAARRCLATRPAPS